MFYEYSFHHNWIGHKWVIRRNYYNQSIVHTDSVVVVVVLVVVFGFGCTSGISAGGVTSGKPESGKTGVDAAENIEWNRQMNL